MRFLTKMPSKERWTLIPAQKQNAYALLNARVGFKATNGLAVIVWGRNVTDKDYYEQLLAAPGNHGQYAGVVGDPQTYGVTLRYNWR